ncbi:MAG TPA: universal stress protein [Dehalococcoidales bacterium]|nr:universal stress protein [Dehalococcoidales bacterium]
MYQRILVPLDGSDRAELALPFAEELAAKLGSEIILLCVSDSAEAEDYAKHEIYLEQITEVVKRAAKKLLTNPEQKVSIRSAVTIGLPAQEIVDYAEQVAVSLIIMATHGRTGVSRWALGSVAEKVMRASTRPVLLVRVPGASIV